MKYSGIKLLGIVAIGLMSVVGCSSQTNTDVKALQEQLVTIQEENKVLQENIDVLQIQVNQLTTENKSLVLEVEQLTKEEYFLYSRDIDSWEITEEGKVKIDKTLPLKEKVEQLAKELSQSLFEGLTIEVKEVKKVDGQDIAVVDLQETEGSEVSWMRDYFQGSAGGMITQTKLEETLLQRNNKVEWIDGIQLHYEGKELFIDHLVFEDIIYR